MSLPEGFVIVDGLLTVEEIRKPCWLVRGRENDSSLTARYRWVTTIAHGKTEGECEIKGYLARKGQRMDSVEIDAMHRICGQLGFTVGGYDRVHESGELRVSRRREKKYFIV